MKGVQRLTKASLLAALGVSVALSGCSQESASGGSDGNAGGGNGPKVKLVFWSHQAEAFNDNYKKMIDSYMKAHPNVEISYQSFPYDVYNQKLKASFSAQNPPDIAEVFGTWVPEYSKNGLLSEVPGGEEAGKAYYEAPLGGFKWDGKLYG
ncbi:ABC transporter substrate-binding protein, partial [Paenibacillus sp. A3]|uniref:ABC transporter substrate-binding protein n=1 Tax=Paenibacillus sp. A3 TaxID=1337054 RepID=UPI0006E6A8D4